VNVSAGRLNRYSPEGGVDGPSPGGVTLFSGEFSPPTGWQDIKPWVVFDAVHVTRGCMSENG